MSVEVCTITIRMEGEAAIERDEDIVKDVWPYMLPWFTRRRGVERGVISMTVPARGYDDAVNVTITWAYTSDLAPLSTGGSVDMAADERKDG